VSQIIVLIINGKMPAKIKSEIRISEILIGLVSTKGLNAELRDRKIMAKICVKHNIEKMFTNSNGRAAACFFKVAYANN